NEPKGMPFKLLESAVLTNATGTGGVTLAGVQSPSSNGVVITRSGGEIRYTGALTNDDVLVYIVSSTSGGCLATNTIVILATEPGGTNQTQNITGIANNGDGSVTVGFAGIPNRNYVIQATTNLSNPVWESIATNNSGTNGLWNYT